MGGVDRITVLTGSAQSILNPVGGPLTNELELVSYGRVERL